MHCAVSKSDQTSLLAIKQPAMEMELAVPHESFDSRFSRAMYMLKYTGRCRCAGHRFLPISNKHGQGWVKTGLTIDSPWPPNVCWFFFFRTPGNLLISSLATLILIYYRSTVFGYWVFQSLLNAPLSSSYLNIKKKSY